MSQARLFQVDGPTCVPSSRPEAGAGEGWWSLVSVVVPTDSPMIPIIISEISTVSLFLALPRGSRVSWAEVSCLWWARQGLHARFAEFAAACNTAGSATCGAFPRVVARLSFVLLRVEPVVPARYFGS